MILERFLGTGNETQSPANLAGLFWFTGNFAATPQGSILYKLRDMSVDLRL